MDGGRATISGMNLITFATGDRPIAGKGGMRFVALLVFLKDLFRLS